MLSIYIRRNAILATLVLVIPSAVFAAIALDALPPEEPESSDTPAVVTDVRKTKPQPLRLLLDLVGGSRVIGVPRIKAIPVQTPHGKMDIPLKHIISVKIEDGHKTASFELLNGDQLTGVLNLKSIQLETIFGKVRIGIQHVRTIEIYQDAHSLPAPIKVALVLHYSFDRDVQNTATDQSGNKHNGAIHGTKRLVIGKRNGARLFDGNDDHIDGKVTASGLGLGGAQPRTINLWARPNAVQSTFLVVMGDRSRSLAQFGIKLRTDSKFDLDCHSIGIHGGSYKPGQWYMVTAVYDAAKIKLYVNSVKVADRAVKLRTRDGNRLFIGSNAGGSIANFKGALDEVMIWKRALSEKEISRLYNSQK